MESDTMRGRNFCDWCFHGCGVDRCIEVCDGWMAHTGPHRCSWRHGGVPGQARRTIRFSGNPDVCELQLYNLAAEWKAEDL